MGAGEFHGRVRDGIGCRLPAMATRSSGPSGSRQLSGRGCLVLVHACDVVSLMNDDRRGVPPLVAPSTGDC